MLGSSRSLSGEEYVHCRFLKAAAEYDMSSPDGRTVAGVPVTYQLNIRIVGARRYLVRLVYPSTLVMCGARISRLGTLMPEIGDTMEDGPWDEKWRSSTVNLGLIKPLSK